MKKEETVLPKIKIDDLLIEIYIKDGIRYEKTFIVMQVEPLKTKLLSEEKINETLEETQ